MDWTGILHGIIDTVIYSVLGIVLMGLGFLINLFFTPFSIKKEIEDDQNISLGIIIGAVIHRYINYCSFSYFFTDSSSTPVEKD